MICTRAFEDVDTDPTESDRWISEEGRATTEATEDLNNLK